MSKRKKRGLIFVVCGIVLLGIIFVPLISVTHGSPAGFLISDEDWPQVLTHQTYSLFDFMQMMFSNRYSIGGYVSAGVIGFIGICFSSIVIIYGVMSLVRKESIKVKEKI